MCNLASLWNQDYNRKFSFFASRPMFSLFLRVLLCGRYWNWGQGCTKDHTARVSKRLVVLFSGWPSRSCPPPTPLGWTIHLMLHQHVMGRLVLTTRDGVWLRSVGPTDLTRVEIILLTVFYILGNKCAKAGFAGEKLIQIPFFPNCFFRQMSEPFLSFFFSFCWKLNFFVCECFPEKKGCFQNKFPGAIKTNE